MQSASYVWRNIQAQSYNHFCSGKATNITYRECACVALGIQHAMRLRHIVICGMAWSTVFYTLSHKWHDFRKIKLLNIKYPIFFLTIV
jgi:hypothetical protein